MSLNGRADDHHPKTEPTSRTAYVTSYWLTSASEAGLVQPGEFSGILAKLGAPRARPPERSGNAGPRERRRRGSAGRSPPDLVRAATLMHTLFHKVWNAHAVRVLPSGQTQLFVGLHLIHEVTSPQAFDMLRHQGWRVAYPERTFATVDHIVPTSAQSRPFLDVTAEEMTTVLERNCREFGIQLWAPGGQSSELKASSTSSARSSD